MEDSEFDLPESIRVEGYFQANTAHVLVTGREDVTGNAMGSTGMLMEGIYIVSAFSDDVSGLLELDYESAGVLRSLHEKNFTYWLVHGEAGLGVANRSAAE